MWDENAELKDRVDELETAAESEQRYAEASPTSWVFKWRAAGWGPGACISETRDFGGGAEGWCTLQCSDTDEESHFIGFEVDGIATCRIHATLSILDKHDKILRKVFEVGTSAPFAIDDAVYWGEIFTPTAEEKAQSVRADGSIRLRAVVRLFLDDAL